MLMCTQLHFGILLQHPGKADQCSKMSTLVTLSAGLLSRQQQSVAFRNICGQLCSLQWGGGSKGKKLAFNKQDNGCHTPSHTTTTPNLISFLLSPS